MGANRLKEMITHMAEKTVKVRTTMRPDRELEVSPQEALDLKRQGLLAEDAKEEATPERRAPKAKGEQA